MVDSTNNKRYQELSKPYRIYLWLRWMPYGYIKGLAWYFVKRLRWENVSDNERGRISLETCIGICVGTIQGEMKWYYTSEEVFGDDGSVRKRDEPGFIEKMFDFFGGKIINIVDSNGNGKNIL